MKWGILSLQCFQFGGDGQAQLFGLDDGAQHIQKAVVTAAHRLLVCSYSICRRTGTPRLASRLAA